MANCVKISTGGGGRRSHSAPGTIWLLLKFPPILLPCSSGLLASRKALPSLCFFPDAGTASPGGGGWGRLRDHRRCSSASPPPPTKKAAPPALFLLRTGRWGAPRQGCKVTEREVGGKNPSRLVAQARCAKCLGIRRCRRGILSPGRLLCQTSGSRAAGDLGTISAAC